MIHFWLGPFYFFLAGAVILWVGPLYFLGGTALPLLLGGLRNLVVRPQLSLGVSLSLSLSLSLFRSLVFFSSAPHALSPPAQRVGDRVGSTVLLSLHWALPGLPAH